MENLNRDLLEQIVTDLVKNETHENAELIRSKFLSNTEWASSKSAGCTASQVYIWGTLDFVTDDRQIKFEGSHWGLGLGAQSASGTLYYNSCSEFKKATKYSANFGGLGVGYVFAWYFDDNGNKVGYFQGIAAGAFGGWVSGSGKTKSTCQ